MGKPSSQQPAGALTRDRKCCKCSMSPRIMALSRCGHARVCHACTLKFATQWLTIKCPTCDDPYVGFPWHLLAYVVDTMKWEAEIYIFNLLNERPLESPYKALLLEPGPLPPLPDQCARCTYGHAIYVNVNEGRRIKLCGQCSITVLEILAGYPIKTTVITLD